MARYRCNTCEGEYEAEQAGGTLYFHTCPGVLHPVTGEIHPRRDARDENPDPAATAPLGQNRPPRAEGTGRTLLRAGPPPPRPPLGGP